jgi:hypothetical protein
MKHLRTAHPDLTLNDQIEQPAAIDIGNVPYSIQTVRSSEYHRVQLDGEQNRDGSTAEEGEAVDSPESDTTMDSRSEIRRLRESLAEKDEMLAEKDKMLAEKDQVLAENGKEIERLRQVVEIKDENHKRQMDAMLDRMIQEARSRS